MKKLIIGLVFLIASDAVAFLRNYTPVRYSLYGQLGPKSSLYKDGDKWSTADTLSGFGFSVGIDKHLLDLWLADLGVGYRWTSQFGDEYVLREGESWDYYDGKFTYSTKAVYHGHSVYAKLRQNLFFRSLSLNFMAGAGFGYDGVHKSIEGDSIKSETDTYNSDWNQFYWIEPSFDFNTMVFDVFDLGFFARIGANFQSSKTSAFGTGSDQYQGTYVFNPSYFIGIGFQLGNGFSNSKRLYREEQERKAQYKKDSIQAVFDRAEAKRQDALKEMERQQKEKYRADSILNFEKNAKIQLDSIREFAPILQGSFVWEKAGYIKENYPFFGMIDQARLIAFNKMNQMQNGINPWDTLQNVTNELSPIFANRYGVPIFKSIDYLTDRQLLEIKISGSRDPIEFITHISVKPSRVEQAITELKNPKYRPILRMKIEAGRIVVDGLANAELIEYAEDLHYLDSIQNNRGLLELTVKGFTDSLLIRKGDSLIRISDSLFYLKSESNLGELSNFAREYPNSTIVPKIRKKIAEYCPPVLVDPRDGQKYKTVLLGDRCWMAQNLNYTTSTSSCYANSKKNCKKFGSLYYRSMFNYENPCPKGWHVPNDDEWDAVNNVIKGKDLGDRSWYGNNASGFAALPAGAVYANNFESIGESAVFCSASDGGYSDSGEGPFISLYEVDKGSKKFENGSSLYLSFCSVRCLLD